MTAEQIMTELERRLTDEPDMASRDKVVLFKHAISQASQCASSFGDLKRIYETIEGWRDSSLPADFLKSFAIKCFVESNIKFIYKIDLLWLTRRDDEKTKIVARMLMDLVIRIKEFEKIPIDDDSQIERIVNKVCQKEG